MRLSKTGLALAGSFVILSTASGLYGWTQDDVKTATFFMQLPLVPSFAVAYGLGLIDWFASIPWLLGYAFCIPATAGALYLLAWIVGWVLRRETGV